MADFDNNLDKNIDYYDFSQSTATNLYISATYHPTGHLRAVPAEALDVPLHQRTLYLESEALQVTIPENSYEISENETLALLDAMRSSTKLLSRGRLVK